MKLYYSIREVGDILGIEPYTIRYWEKEFRISPKRKRNRRFYKQDNINDLLLVKDLLYERGYTINGAKKVFKRFKKRVKMDLNEVLVSIRNEIEEVVNILE
ncbi:MerR family transcriptional regulator [candidate division WOR-3 bacterium]|nr:MerR family transcriptional regulator [candidate division WOR-3 bacterium]